MCIKPNFVLEKPYGFIAPCFTFAKCAAKGNDIVAITTTVAVYVVMRQHDLLKQEKGPIYAFYRTFAANHDYLYVQYRYWTIPGYFLYAIFQAEI